MDIKHLDQAQKAGCHHLAGALKKLNLLLAKLEFDQLWPGFSPVPFALYDAQFFVINQAEGFPFETIAFEEVRLGQADQRLAGNTAIKLGERFLAIWRLERERDEKDMKALCSLIVHEMFHGFQMASHESRFANELFGIDYPMCRENLQLRMAERQLLQKAALSEDSARKRWYLSQFFHIRQQRARQFPSPLAYEKGIETIEGCACYVEYQALLQLDPGHQISRRLAGFTDLSLETLEIRKSSYAQGLLLCLLADQLLPGWQQDFFQQTAFLSDLIEQALPPCEELPQSPPKWPDVDPVLETWTLKRDQAFLDFENRKTGQQVSQEIRISGFDPMNIVKRGNELIHRSFLKVSLDGEERLIPGPVKTVIGDSLFDVKTLIW